MDSLFSSLAAECRELRRRLHQQPELSGQEFSTRTALMAELKQLGFEPRAFEEHAGITALWPGESPSSGCIALRADMDALPLQEETDLVYASQTPGVMHACGHDGHMAILLGVAKWLAHQGKQGRRFPKAVKLIFQPSEEAEGGALMMIGSGALKEPEVEAIFALHGWPELPAGTVAAPDRAVMAAVDNFTLKLQGKGGHGGMPHLTQDPIVAAAAIITASQTLVSRRISPLDSAVVTFGHLSAGETFNVIPETCLVRGTVRSLDAKVRVAVRQDFESLVKHTGLAMGVESELEWLESCPPTVNSPDMAARVRTAALHTLGPNCLRDVPPSMGGEDFAFFLEQVPGAYFWLGLGMERGGLHNPHFDFNDATLAAGIAVFTGIIEGYPV
jgi:amidohydrolase